MKWLLSFLLLALLGAVQAASSSGNRLLVLVEELADRDKYSQFLSDLQARGFSIDYSTPKSSGISLFRHGERAYDHVLLFPGKAKGLGPELTPHKILEFASKEGNILLALSGESTTPTSIVSLLLELDIHLPSDRNSIVVDHFNYDSASAADKHDVLLLPPPTPLRPGVKTYFSGDGLIAVPRAVGQTLGNTSPLLSPVLRAPSTAYSYNPKEEADVLEDPFAVGEQLSLITTMQARNNARFTVLGSSEMLQNKWFDAKVKHNDKEVKTVNRDFSKKVAGWTFKETGVLKVGRLQHYADDFDSSKGKPSYNVTSVNVPEDNPTIYRIKSDVTYMIELSEWVEDRWTPFTPAVGDKVQLEFSMLSPFHRLNLSPVSQTPESTIYGVHFKTPDQHGIFNFRVNYKRPFLTNVDEKRQVTVRHFAHDEWPRSYAISGAWVWISGIWITIAGWLAFVALWLYSAPTEKSVKKNQ
ncbi:dolichyl-diphosphooligosaccharide-protein glycosyltransferase [Pseudovirgaria hyperparasitica]|uniref:Dolichyl-diphosphooligosaccharide--protein glycosyltransferase subunit WBP1 n=1 Tax=Pseudovirgaria hyperparasitica TaxID=470096 RepID=A0A6A6WBG8_9PEZI|nr:dolichyl-diphosphooligosaccharide-protein glycosyltransferase [Pseudovirgaria hyperparasitica]KAF2758947.1 dolichyl-diphosphooligosaccharide-protein glycosyltransferase [Pseudovirgaria hyperparasitica]